MKLNTNMKKRSPPAGAERHALPNVTTGLQGDSLNRLENLKVLLCT